MSHENENKETLISELSERLFNGVIKENPTFVLLLGMCPTLAVTTSAINGLGMGVTTMVVLALSNLFIALLRKVIPDKIRIPAFIVIIASFVTIVELLLEAYIPVLYDALGLYIPLIVVNCIILGRAEAYAYTHKALPSLFDGLGMGMGFTFALTIIGAFRELLGAGEVFGFRVMPSSYIPVSIFIMAPGAFFVLAILTAIQNKIKDIGTKKGKDMSKIQSGCGGNCLDCTKECKVSLNVDNVSEKIEDIKEEPAESLPIEKNVVSATKHSPKVKEEKTSDKMDEEISTKEDVSENESSDNKEPVEEAVTEKEENSALETASETKTENEESSENETEETSDDKLNSLDLMDIQELKSQLKAKSNGQKKPKHKKASLEKAKAMLDRAEENLKEESND